MTTNSVYLRKAEEARLLREEGLLFREIAVKMKLSKSYVTQLLNDPTGEKTKARKVVLGGICQYCGKPTSGGSRKVPAHSCASCFARNRPKFWTREMIIDKIKEWADLHEGEPPVATMWLRQVEGSPGQYIKGPKNLTGASRRWPPVSAIQREFGSWAEGIEAAGFPRPIIGKYVRKPKTRAKMSESRRVIDRDQVRKLLAKNYSDEEIAERLNCGVTSIRGIRSNEFGIKKGKTEPKGIWNRLTHELTSE